MNSRARFQMKAKTTAAMMTTTMTSGMTEQLQYVIKEIKENSERFIYLYEHFQCWIDQHDSSVTIHNEVTGVSGWKSISLAVPRSIFSWYIC